MAEGEKLFLQLPEKCSSSSRDVMMRTVTAKSSNSKSSSQFVRRRTRTARGLKVC